MSPFITTKIPTEFEDDDTVAPWADFTPENQAANWRLAGSVQLANTGAGIPAMPPPARATPPADASAVAPDAAACQRRRACPRARGSSARRRGRRACPAASPSSGHRSPQPVAGDARGCREPAPGSRSFCDPPAARRRAHRRQVSCSRAAPAARRWLLDRAVAAGVLAAADDCRVAVRANRRHMDMDDNTQSSFSEKRRSTTKRESEIGRPDWASRN